MGQFASAPAFPGAEGYGRYTTGGRGGTVYHVTTLEDYCDNTDYSATKTKDSEIVGSLRSAIKKSGARIIVFDVAGTIELKAPLKIQNDNITILGQTAPGDGICLKNFTVNIAANNVIIRYIRCRLGNDGRRYYNSGTALSGTDQIVEDDAMNAYQKTGSEKKNIIIDHCSISWSVDECGSFYGNQDFTLQWCLLTESLKNAGHTKGNHGYGGIWGGERASFHHNMLANHDSRNPRFDHGYVSTLAGPVDYTNNVLYNWGSNSAYGGENLKGQTSKKFNMINNYYRYGGATGDKDRLLNPTTYCTNCNSSDGTDIVPGTFYISGNYMYGFSTVTNDNTCSNAIQMDSKGKSYSDWKSGYVSNTKFKATTQDFASYNTISLHTAENTYNKVLQYAGASYKRDAVDTRVCNDAKNGTTSYTTSTGKGSNGATGGHIDQPSDVGGYPTLTGTKATDGDGDGIPDEWEDAHNLNKNDASDALTYTLDSHGYYQNLEVYANYLVQDITKAERAGAAESFEEYYPIASADPTDPTTPETDPTPSTGTLTWDYTSAAPSSSPDNGLTYASTVNDASGTNNGLKGIKLNSSGYCYFTKSAIPGTLAITFGPRTGTNAASISVYSYASTPSAETIIGTTETTTALATKTIELSAEQNNIYLIRGASTETVITKIVFTPSSNDSSDDNDDDDATIEDPDPAPVAVKPAAKKAFDFIVGKDGDADAAIAAANADNGSGRYLIFVPNGTYDMTTKQSWKLGSDKSAMTGTDGSTVSPGSTFSNNATWLTRSNVSIIGQSESGTKLRNTPVYPGISYTSTLEIRSGKSNTYIQDLTLYNNYANGANDKGVAVAFYDRGTNTILKNVNCWSNQDTYTSAATRCYYETSTFAGTVDFICGSGDVWFEKCDLVINDRTSPDVITAPSTTSEEEWGFVFNSCTINPANSSASSHQGGKYSLGRPWKVAPASTFINTKMNILPSDAAWTNMTSGLTIRFHEYGSTNSSGTLLDLSKRSVSACAGVKADKPVLTAAQASTYKVSSVLGGDSNWDPRALALQVNVSNAKLNGNTLSWDNNDYALCWVVFKNGEYYANPTTNSIALTESGTYTVRAANSMGGLGEASSEVVYAAPAATYTVSYNLNGHGTAVENVKETTTLPSTFPTLSADGYAFWGWYTDESCTTAAVANAPISKNTTLYAKWTDASTTPGAWAIDFSAIGTSESLADKAGVVISSSVGKIGSTDFGLTKMGNTYLDSRFVIQTSTTWIYRTAQKAIYSSNSGPRSFGMRNMKAGQTITMKVELGESATTITATNATLTSSENNIWTYNVTADGDVAFSINRYSYIYSIEVSEVPATTEECNATFTSKDFTSKTGNKTKEGVTLTLNVESYKDANHSDAMKCKSTGNTLTFSSNNTITSITLSCTSDNFTKVKVTPSDGEVRQDNTNNTISWIGSAKNVVLTFGRADNQTTDQSVYVQSIKVVTEVMIYELSEDKDYNTFTEGTYTVKLKRTFDIGKWTTLVLPFDINESMLTETFGTDAEVAEVTKMESDKLYYKNTTSIKANEPVLIKVTSPTADNTYTFTRVTVKNATNATTVSADGTQLVGLYKATTWNDLPEELFFLYDGKFYDYSYLNTLRAFRAYLLPYEGFKVSAKGMSFMLDDTVTGITSNMDTETESTIYNIAGQRIENTIKGLHIKNGKKYLVR